MKYGDELDRIPTEAGLSRRQFLAAGGHRAIRVAGVLLTGGAEPPVPDPTGAATADEPAEGPARRDS